LNLIVIVRELGPSEVALAAAARGESMVCDRCRKAEEMVVAIVQALPLRNTWAICDACKQELPQGFYLV
jgi:hypothetical protein